MAYPGPQNDVDADEDNFETANHNHEVSAYNTEKYALVTKVREAAENEPKINY